MRLVIFDIDGTLMQTVNAHTECFLRSLGDVCGFRDVDTDWSRYKHATDSGAWHAGIMPVPQTASSSPLTGAAVFLG